MLTITFHNDGTGSVEVGNYDYCVYVNDMIIQSGRVEGHNRREGWKELVRHFADVMSTQNDNPETKKLLLQYLISETNQRGCK